MFLPVAKKAAFGNRIYYLAQDLIAWPFGKRDFVIITGKSEKSRIITEGKKSLLFTICEGMVTREEI